MGYDIWITIIGSGSAWLSAILVFIVQMKKMKNESIERSQKQIEEIKNSIENKLDSQKKETVEEITKLRKQIEDSNLNISDLKAQYKNTVSIIEFKIDTLEKKQDKHNNVIERTFLLEQANAVQNEQLRGLQESMKTNSTRLSNIENALENHGR